MKFRTGLIAAIMVAAMIVAVATGLVGTASIASAAHSRPGLGSGHRPKAYTCTGGSKSGGDPSMWAFVRIPSGTYSRLTVKGVCQTAPGATINVVGDVTVAADAVLDAQSFPSTITVGGNVTAAAGSLLGLGCLPNPKGHTTGHPCVRAKGSKPKTSMSSITIDGNLKASKADTVLLDGIMVRRNVALAGGGGEIPWAIKDNTIGGNLVVRDMTPNWLGVIRNWIGHDTLLANVNITDGLPPNNDPNPTIFVASNTVGWNLICIGLGPHVAGGFTGEVNVVGGQAIDQCAHLSTFSPQASS
jgi:hypothetical protein